MLTIVKRRGALGLLAHGDREDVFTRSRTEMVGAHGMEDSLLSYAAIQNSSFSDTNIVGRVLADDRGRDAGERLLRRRRHRPGRRPAVSAAQS